MTRSSASNDPDELPPDYVRINTATAHAVALTTVADAVRTVLGSTTLYEHAARRARRTWHGRGAVYAVQLGEADAVIRHVRHGGALAPVTRDLFWGPTRAPRELATAVRLRKVGILTPEVLAYAVYPAGCGLARVDVVTREIVDGRDLLTLLAPSADVQVDAASAWSAVSELLDAMTTAGALHPDLNVKNVVLVASAPNGWKAYVLDVDRVIWRRPGEAAVHAANARRLRRSAVKQGLL